MCYIDKRFYSLKDNRVSQFQLRICKEHLPSVVFGDEMKPGKNNDFLS